MTDESQGGHVRGGPAHGNIDGARICQDRGFADTEPGHLQEGTLVKSHGRTLETTLAVHLYVGLRCLNIPLGITD